VEQFGASYKPYEWAANGNFFHQTSVIPANGFCEAEREQFKFISHTGPELLTRIWQRSENAAVNVLEKGSFFMINWRNINQFFMPSHPEFVEHDMQILRQKSFVLHFWNKISSGLEIADGCLMHRVLNEFCVLCDKEVS
jgi:hypothetical protein